MKNFSALTVSAPALALVFATMFAPLLHAQDAASETDKAFVAKVSQGGSYEVEASKLAVQKATAQDVKDLAIAEVHDHELVNRELKTISASKGVTIAPTPNAEFKQRLETLKAVSAADFDAAYIKDMAAIHAKDEKLFAQEAIDGGASQYKAFAAKTDLIVKRHIGTIHGTDQ
jgi:putative membrane protein